MSSDFTVGGRNQWCIVMLVLLAHISHHIMNVLQHANGCSTNEAIFDMTDSAVNERGCRIAYINGANQCSCSDQ